jgi:outer membrane immunogenic protein
LAPVTLNPGARYQFSNGSPFGAIGGAHLGYYYQISKSFVVGGLAELDLSNINGGKTVAGGGLEGVAVSSLSMRNTWQGFLLARAGFAFDRLLIYGTGGLALADDQESFSVYDPAFSPFPYAASGSQTKTLVGWAIGAGTEYAFSAHWSASAEVRYADFGKANYSFPTTLSRFGNVNSYNVRFTETIGLIGLSYRF